MIELNRQSKTPIGDQLVNGLARLVKERSLLPGARLPSVRQLAERLGISHSSVVVAYGRLASMGVIDARRGSGHYVATRRNFSEAADDEGGRQEPNDAVSHAMNALDIRADCVPVGSGFLPASWFEEAFPSSVIGHLLRRELTIASPAPAQGVSGFRRQLACKLDQQGIHVTPRTLVTTFGASHAFSLVTRALIRPGDPVIVEDPGYLVLHAACDERRSIAPNPTPDGWSGSGCNRRSSKIGKTTLLFHSNIVPQSYGQQYVRCEMPPVARTGRASQLSNRRRRCLRRLSASGIAATGPTR
jgi:DNA-binding transcriptional MocR family regulator